MGNYGRNRFLFGSAGALERQELNSATVFDGFSPQFFCCIRLLRLNQSIGTARIISFATFMFLPTQVTFLSLYYLSTFIAVALTVLVLFLKAASDTFEPTDRKTDQPSPVKWLKRIHFSEKKKRKQKTPTYVEEEKSSK